MLHGGMNATAVTGSELHHLLLTLLETTHSRLWISCSRSQPRGFAKLSAMAAVFLVRW